MAPDPASCPHPDSQRVGVVIREQYDGILFWACTCGHAWPREIWEPGSRRARAATRAAASHVAAQAWRGGAR